ncbi:hypothetical protein HQ531_00220 [bacterium]|nr:hypothetical protein [bacterium]
MQIYRKINKGILILGMILISSTLWAQPDGGQQGPPRLPDSKQVGEMVKEVSQTLALTKKQESQISKLYFNHFEQARQMMDKGKATQQDHHKAMDALRTDFEKQVAELLSDDQKKAYEELKKKRGPGPGQQGSKRK